MGFSGPVETNNETDNINEHNMDMVKNPNWQEERPVGYLQTCLRS